MHIIWMQARSLRVDVCIPSGLPKSCNSYWRPSGLMSWRFLRALGGYFEVHLRGGRRRNHTSLVEKRIADLHEEWPNPFLVRGGHPRRTQIHGTTGRRAMWAELGIGVINFYVQIFQPKQPSHSNTLTGTWWRGGWVDSFQPDSRGFDSRSSRHVRKLVGQVLNSQLPVALRRETPAQYPCCVGSASE